LDLSVNAILVAIERATAGTGSRATSSAGGAANGTANGAANGATNGATNGHGAENGAANGAATSPRRSDQQPHDVTFEVADVLTRDFAQASFDVVVSRDSLLHVEEKQALFAR
jgi:ubiquinone/menaquinone biosynthesis C-methylase UbiE